MSAVALVAGGFVGALAAALALIRVWRPSASNYRGARVPVVLGLATGAGVTAGVVSHLLLTPNSRLGSLSTVTLLAAALVAGAGIADDLAPIGPRGLRGHLRSLASGHMTTGVLKLLVASAAAIVTVANVPRGGALVRIAGVVLVASCTNLWNGLDVHPGRAAKWFVLAAGAVLLSGISVTLVPIVPATLGAVVGILPFDLLERGMLGDGGSNLLGYVAGVGLYLALPVSAIAVAALLAIGLNLAAETITLSSVIERVPPLAWFDRLGRLPG